MIAKFCRGRTKMTKICVKFGEILAYPAVAAVTCCSAAACCKHRETISATVLFSSVQPIATYAYNYCALRRGP